MQVNGNYKSTEFACFKSCLLPTKSWGSPPSTLAPSNEPSGSVAPSTFPSIAPSNELSGFVAQWAFPSLAPHSGPGGPQISSTTTEGKFPCDALVTTDNGLSGSAIQRATWEAAGVSWHHQSFFRNLPTSVHEDGVVDNCTQLNLVNQGLPAVEVSMFAIS